MPHSTGKSFAGKSPSGHRPPPNYSSRWLQLRLLVLVFAVMFVLSAMYRVSNPKFWSFMGFDVPNPVVDPLTKQEIADEPVDTRLPPQVSEHASDPIGTITVPKKAAEPELDLKTDEPTSDTQAKLAMLGWTYVDSTLDDGQRTILYKVLKVARDDEPLPDADQASWQALIGHLDESWRQYQVEALRKVVEKSDAEKAVLLPALQRLQQGWTSEVKPAMQAAAAGSELLENTRAALDELQDILDTIALRQVKDNTVASVYSEKEAWFRLFDRLSRTDERVLREMSVGRVGYLQLYRQPKEYRGKLVTIRGTVIRAYHVRAPRNIYDIPGYYIFNLMPAGGPNEPVIIYALETPPGFPEIKDKDVDRKLTTLYEDVEFTGYFFKNVAFRAKVGTRVEPLLLAKVPRWDGPSGGAPETGQVSIPVLVLIVAIIAAVAVSFAVLVYRRSVTIPASVAQYSSARLQRPEQLKSLDDAEVNPTVSEMLRQLAGSEPAAISNDKAQSE